MPIDPRRLLGLAFASADLLVEIDSDERVSLVLGAGQSVLGTDMGDPVGRDWRTLIHGDDQALVEAMIICVADGVRRAYAPVRLSGVDRAVSLSARGLPENAGRVSCALTACPMPPVPATAAR